MTEKIKDNKQLKKGNENEKVIWKMAEEWSL